MITKQQETLTKESYKLFNNTCFIRDTLKQIPSNLIDFNRNMYGRQIIITLMRTPALLDRLDLTIYVTSSKILIADNSSNNFYTVHLLYQIIDPLLSHGRIGMEDMITGMKHYRKTITIPKKFYL